MSKVYVPKTSLEAEAVIEWLRLAKPVNGYSVDEIWVTGASNNQTAYIPLIRRDGTVLLDKDEYVKFVDELRKPFGRKPQIVEMLFKDGRRYIVDIHAHYMWVYNKDRLEIRSEWLKTLKAERGLQHAI